MPTIPVRSLGEIGIVKDVNAFALPSNAWSDGINVRFDNGKVERSPIFRTLQDGLTGAVPVWCYGIYVQSGFDSTVYANDDGKLYMIANGTETDYTETDHTDNVDPRPFTGCTLAQCTYVNRPDAVPRYLTPDGTQFDVLPNWDSTWRCVSLRSFKSALVALNITKGSTDYPALVKTSDFTTAGSAPGSWDETDDTKLATENELSQLRTPLVDGGPLGDNFILYSRDEVWKMVYDGSQFIYSYQRLPFDNAGLINPNCWVEIDGQHFAWGENDIYVHDGVSKTSIIDGKNRDTFFRELNIQRSNVFFVAHDKYRREIIFCGVSGAAAASIKTPNGYCNYGAVYNYVHGTWTFVDLPNASFSTTANANTVFTWDTVPSGLTWDNVGGTWYDQEDSFSRYAVVTVVADSANGISSSRLDVLDGGSTSKIAAALDSETVFPAWVERLGLDLDQVGADLRGYKQVRAVLPQVAVYEQNVSLTVQVGGHITSGSPVAYDGAASFDPANDYKIDTRRGGRYLAYRFTMIGAHDFDLPGFDLDLTITGHR